MSEGATGGTCAETVFDGRVEGLPGVATFAGIALAGVVHEFLFDPHGNVVGADQPVLLTVGKTSIEVFPATPPDGTNSSLLKTIARPVTLSGLTGGVAGLDPLGTVPIGETDKPSLARLRKRSSPAPAG